MDKRYIDPPNLLEMSMNTTGKGLQYRKVNPWTEQLTNKRTNLLEILPIKITNGDPSTSTIATSGSLNNKHQQCLIYDSDALKTISKQLQHDQRLRQLNFGIISRIMELKLNCKPRKGKPHVRKHKHQTCINRSNLITVKNGHKGNSNTIFSTCNIQSIKFKELQVSELINDYSLDFVLATETWISDKQNSWKYTPILNRDGLKLFTCDRVNRKGCGIAIIIKS